MTYTITRQQYQVADLIEKGFADPVICNRLDFKNATLKAHVSALYSAIERDYPAETYNRRVVVARLFDIGAFEVKEDGRGQSPRKELE